MKSFAKNKNKAFKSKSHGEKRRVLEKVDVVVVVHLYALSPSRAIYDEHAKALLLFFFIFIIILNRQGFIFQKNIRSMYARKQRQTRNPI